MTFKEFEAWLEGFQEGWTGYSPNVDQWQKIKAKLKTVENPLDSIKIGSPSPYTPPFKKYWTSTSPYVSDDSIKTYTPDGLPHSLYSGGNQSKYQTSNEHVGPYGNGVSFPSGE